MKVFLCLLVVANLTATGQNVAPPSSQNIPATNLPSMKIGKERSTANRSLRITGIEWYCAGQWGWLHPAADA